MVNHAEIDNSATVRAVATRTSGNVAGWQAEGRATRSGRSRLGWRAWPLVPVLAVILFGVGTPHAASASSLAVGYYHTCALTSVGGVKCWGYNAHGQLGDGTQIDRLMPVDVGGLTGVTAISAGEEYTCALTSVGTVKCWGSNFDGQLGDGTNVDRHTPVNVSGISDATAISAGPGETHTCALTSMGGVKCWGDNQYGQLGDGTFITSPTPVDVSGLGDATAIALGGNYTCALTNTGGVKCWGDNRNFQLGQDGRLVGYSATPLDVPDIDGATAIAAGVAHTCVLTGTAGVKCWGENGYGELGDGTTTFRYQALDVNNLSDVIAITAGGEHTHALTSGGGAKSWGINYVGMLGDGTTTARYTPVDVSDLANATEIVAGYYNTCAVISTGGIKCWGLNFAGEVGDGTTTDQYTPVDVVGLSTPGPCSLIALTPDPNPAKSTVEEGGQFWRYYQVACSDGRSLEGTAADFETPAGLSGPVVFGSADANGIMKLNAVSDDVGPAGSSATLSLLQLGGATPAVPLAFTVNVLPHPVTRGYELGFGAGGSVGPGIQLTAGVNYGVGIDFDETKGDLASHDDDHLSLSRRIDQSIGVQVGGSIGGQAGPGRFIADDSGGAKALSIGEDGYEFSDIWNSLDQQTAVIGFILDSLPTRATVFLPGNFKVKLPGGAITPLVNYIVNSITNLEQYRSVTGDGEGLNGSFGLGGETGVFNCNPKDGNQHCHPADGQNGFGITVEGNLDLSAEYFEESFPGSEEHPDASFERSIGVDGELDLSAAAGVVQAKDEKLKKDLTDLFSVGVGTGVAGGIKVRAVFSPNGATLQKAELEIEQTRNFLGASGQAMKFEFDGTEATAIASAIASFADDNLSPLTVLQPGAELQLVLGPAQAASDIIDLLKSIKDNSIPYTYERTKKIGQSSDDSIKVGGGDWGIEIPLSAETHLLDVIDRSAGRGTLYQLEEYPESQYSESDLFPNLESLVENLTSNVMEDAIQAVFSSGDSCGLLSVLDPTKCLGSVFSNLNPLSALAVRQNAEPAGAQSVPSAPSFGIGGYHMFAPNGFLLTSQWRGTLASSNGRARLTLANGIGTLVIAYDPAEVASTWESTLRLHQWIDADKRWALVGGTIDTATHAVTAQVKTLGLFTLSPVVPTGAIAWQVPVLDARTGDVAVPTATILGSDGRPIRDGTLVTVALRNAFRADGVGVGTILNQDVDPGTPGIQVATKHGAIRVTWASPTGGGTAILVANSVVGDASGATRVSVQGGAVVPWETPKSATTPFTLSKANLRVPKVVGKTATFSFKGSFGSAADVFPFSSGSDVTFEIRDTMGVVYSATLPGLSVTTNRSGATWRSKATPTSPGVVIRKKNGQPFAVTISGRGNLSALQAADLRVSLFNPQRKLSVRVFATTRQSPSGWVLTFKSR